VSGAAPEEHWLDRLAVLQTRRQVLRAALAGAALTIPFARTRPAGASGRSLKAPSPDCERGCRFSNQLRYGDALAGCWKGLERGVLTTSAVTLYLNPLYGMAVGGVAFGTAAYCTNQAILRQKAGAWDCEQPGCPGFDPHDKQYGPCASCDQVKGMCCVTQTVLSGYTCCICCDPKGNGCKAPPC
jgi:hypothetical protein